ncbi:MAG: phosphoglycolate phosphatase [Pseudomonadota bacterium]
MTEHLVLLCDLDGTLVDSAIDIANTLNALLQEQKRPLLSKEEISNMVGDGVAKLVERGFRATGSCPQGDSLADQVARFAELYGPRMTEFSRPYPGAIAALTSLKQQGWRLAVCTNKPEAASRQMLTDLKMIQLFETITGGDSVGVKKPDPNHLLQTLNKMAASPGEAIMLGDSQIDAKAAKRAGLPFILVTFGYARVPLSQIESTKTISHFDELSAALSEL